ncbi:MAG TPA: adenylyl-sulfate kinase, partial [Patescibacteria group bacterium]|nr:adenylyl-sulfate kinase [Patescibacteria group bacterium]
VARPLRFSVQDVYRVNEQRIVVGRVESGTMHEGDTITIMPTNATTKIKKFVSWPDNGEELTEVAAGDVVGFITEDPVFVNRGQIISHSDSPPTLTNTFNARVFWLHDKPITVGQSLEARFTTARVPVTVQSINRVINTDDLALGEGARAVPKNGVAEITFRASKSLPLDDYNDDGKTGRIALSLDGMNIHGGGIISLKDVMAARKQGPKSENLTAVQHMTSEDLRKEKFGHGGGVFWFTGLSGAGKSTLAMRVEKALIDRGINSMVLDGDNVRNGLNKDLGFSPQDRKENIRRVGEVAALMAQAGVACVTAFISPYQADRDMAREACKGTFHEIYIKADVDTCEGRDPKGLYKKARAGIIKEFTGVSAPYEPPVNPELVIDTETNTVEACVAQIVAYIEQQIKPSLQPEPEKVISFSPGANEDRKQSIRA